jgi:hypothetical protein
VSPRTAPEGRDSGGFAAWFVVGIGAGQQARDAGGGELGEGGLSWAMRVLHMTDRNRHA